MLIFAYYLLKVIICSGILYGYYLVALRNKIFHRWNRFYLLAITVISLTGPLITINIWQHTGETPTQPIRLLQVVNSGDEFVYEYTKDSQSFHIDASNLSIFFYTVISGMLLLFLIKTLVRINKLKKTCQSTFIEGINFINTDAKGTPFSFFNNIFWNRNIDINTLSGKQIFQHEVVHVQEKHTYDKIFMNIVLILFWSNPVFWLIRKELNMIHEFIADKKAVEDNDTAAFAAMILQATYPRQQFNITNNFFYSPLKRRLTMLTKTKNPRINYISRLLVLPVAVIVFLAFTLKAKTYNSNTLYKGKTINVVIDAGHGGDDKGISVDNINEKDLTLSIAKKIKELNKNEKINIILSRENDITVSVKDRVFFSEANKADLFISIHVDGEGDKNTHSGVSVIMPKDNNVFFKDSKLLGTNIVESFKHNYLLPIANDLKQRDKGVWILNANQCPAVLIETGFLTTQKDLEYLKVYKNQQTIAGNILNGIEKYAQQKLSFENIIRDTTAGNIAGNDPVRVFLQQRISEIKGNNATKDYLIKRLSQMDSIPKYYKGKKIKETWGSLKLNKAIIIYEDGSKDSISITEGEKLKIIPPPPPNAKESTTINNGNSTGSTIKLRNADNTLIVVDGIIVSHDKKDLNSISPNSIQLISVLKSEAAIKKYGDNGKDGVIEITTKQKSNTLRDTTPNKIFTKVEIEPSFPGGNVAWSKYITKHIGAHINDLADEGKSGTCRLRFIVETDGSIRDIVALTMQGTKLAEVSVEAIRKGPKWIPATQNGHVVAAYREQPVTFTIEEDSKVFIKVETEAQFPGGHPAWLKYIQSEIKKNVDLIINDHNQGTCLIQFIVDSKGKVSNVIATSMKNTKLAAVAINAIKNGPDWQPATIDGNIVASYRRQPVTFAINDNMIDKAEPK